MKQEHKNVSFWRQQYALRDDPYHSTTALQLNNRHKRNAILQLYRTQYNYNVNSVFHSYVVCLFTTFLMSYRLVCDSDEFKWMPRWSFSSVNAIAMDCVCSNKLDGTFSSINLATSNVRCSSQIVRAQFDVDASCHKCCVDERFCLLLILITMMWRYMGA